MFIVIEGPDGCGKSTQARLLVEKLQNSGYKAILTKEPGSPHDPVCTKLREILLDPQNNIERRTALFLFLADRAQHIEFVRQKLAEGFIVVSDRSALSSWVYYMAEFTDEEMKQQMWINDAIDQAQQIAPDLCFLCSADYEWTLDRLRERSGLDRIEQLGDGVHRKIHRLFDEDIRDLDGVMRYLPKNIMRTPLASNHSIEKIHEFMWEHISKELSCE